MTVMPKGKAANTRRIRELEKKIQSFEEAATPVPPQRDASRPPVNRRNEWDWACPCSYYVYEGKDSCPRCRGPRREGTICYGVKRRQVVASVTVGPRVAGPRFAPTRSVVQPPAQPHQRLGPTRSYLDVAKALPAARPQQQQLQQQARQQHQQLHTQQAVSNQPLQQTNGQRIANTATNPPQQHLERTQNTGATAVVGSSPVVPVQPSSAFAVVKPLGLQQAAATPNATTCKNIFSMDEEAALEQEEAGDDLTIQELDDECKDPHRVQVRMGKIRRALQRRDKRLLKAREAVEEQRMALEAAQQELAVRAANVDEIEADRRRLKEVLHDLSHKYTALVAAEIQQPVHTEPAATNAPHVQQWLYNAAAGLREFGDDPRILQVCAVLGELFHEVSGSGASIASPATATAAVALNPEVGNPTGQAATAQPTLLATPIDNTPPVLAPSSAPSGAGICTSCWSVACRCIPSAAHSEPTDMELVEKRPKRSSAEAALPERVLGAKPSPNAILVDAEGSAVDAAASSEEEVKSKVQQPGQDALGSNEAHSGGNDKDNAGGAPPSSEGAPAAAIDKAAREESKTAFAALVQAACSERSYPY